MDYIYASLIERGIRTFESVPDVDKKAVAKELRSRGSEHLIDKK